MTRRLVVAASMLLVSLAIAFASAGAYAGATRSTTAAQRSPAVPSFASRVFSAREAGRDRIHRQLARRSHHFLFWSHRNRYGTRQSGIGRGFSIGKWLLAIVLLVIAVPITGLILIVWVLRARGRANR